MAAVQREISARSMPLSRMAMFRAAICSSAIAPRVYASIVQSIWAGLSTPLSRLMRMMSTASNASVLLVVWCHRGSSRCWGPKASGRTWSMVLIPWVVMSSMSGARNS